MRLKIDADTKAAIKVVRDVQKAVPAAARSALTRAGQGIKTEANRKVRELYTVKAKDVNAAMKITRDDDLHLRLTGKGKNIPLIKFQTTPRKPPKRPKTVMTSVKKDGGKKAIPGAFIAQVGGHIGAFKRVGKKRLPIQELYGPAVPVMLNNEVIKKHIETEAQKRLSERLDHELNRRLGRIMK
ncbi:Prophage minor tail protein Z (GPZ) [Paenibacillus phage phiERICV]|uniref:Prophage minor tail protein Z (GPZ) n=1 Tax=Paenibacillus larvae subsp. larvae TaxID=147375 RepID=A0A6C0QMV3_9BACL|nr:phage tail protein [Paenibacillus larvae]QHZ50027.1 Prophage minor tail protein Z (GPZ) [Paenibacillus larvae subsp. larvae]QHZ54112.1 Prophage minor tail protein Z (GPZ) [Paenibacillus phage phiERICV]